MPKSYEAVHRQLSVRRGPAVAYQCAKCLEPAREWSYDNADPDELLSETAAGYLVRYSLDLDRYQPLCLPCHRHRDRAARRDRLRAEPPRQPRTEAEWDAWQRHCETWAY